MERKTPACIRRVVVSIAILVLLAVLFISTWRATHSTMVVALVGIWCTLFVVAPAILLKRLMRSGALRPPGRRVMVWSWAVLAVYTLVLAGFEIVTGAGPASWMMTLLATTGFSGAALAARREFS
jgi:hypothetical protein